MSRVQVSNLSRSTKRVALKKHSSLTTALVFCLLSAGCAAHKVDQTTTASIPADYRSNHPIIVAKSEQTADLVVTPTMRSMSHSHRNKVVEIVGRFKRSGAKDIHIILPSGSHNETAARHVSAGVVKEMKNQGIVSNRIKIERYHASNHGDSATIRIVYGALGAHVASECGQWKDELSINDQNTNYGNFGCATQNNLAEMIANPADLISPRGQTEIDAERRDNVISDWRANGS